MKADQLMWLCERLTVIERSPKYGGRLAVNEVVLQALIELLAHQDSPCAALAAAQVKLETAIDEELCK